MGKEHSTLLKEVFIEPIRSVLIVDDDYPTYEEFLSVNLGVAESPSSKSWKDDPAAVMHVIKSFRNLDVPPLVDIHDGSNLDVGGEKIIAKHLHQSDLLVLDYQLDGPGGDGARSIEIIKSLMKSNHFNLVMVHTAANLQEAFDDVLLAVLPPCQSRPSDDKLEATAEKLFALEGKNKGITRRFQDAVQISQYLSLRSNPRAARKAVTTGAEPFKLFKSICSECAISNVSEVLAIFDWCFCDFEDTIAHKLGPADAEVVAWSANGPIWIRSGTSFIAFTNKSRDASLIDDLLTALIDWKPQPSRLFLAKLRAQIDEFGVVAENSVMGSEYVLARWYESLLTGTEETRKTLIGESIDRHTEQLISNIRNKVEEFAAKLVEIDSKRSLSDENVIFDYFSIDLANSSNKRQAERDHNIFVSSKAPAGWHLNTGHVFECDGATWVCLSPACDLVPRPRPAYHEDIGPDVTSFIAVKLHDKGNGLAAVEDIQSNRYVYIKINGAAKLYSFNQDPNANPYWSAMYALNQGKLDDGMMFKVSRVRKSDNALIATVADAKIVGQLRYEYALNLVQKLGGTFTRVGLDFSG
ncbi:hypothetical protein FY133_00745 [Agrobacterium tumefaciens]|uniref:response regulator receiver domain n=1 Tax=Agrobacterium tumefaciens TaxID=358 RepID=UPI0021D28286|nr:response regulator receiver domain [Agrobacterium tumefaciens]UXT64175.1 hypothetical protein FY133_00745 [Agrobacterium tumefaciens]